MGTERLRRQTIGRGLRLCVNQLGERVRGFETNTLTVVATESYEKFAEALQKEIEDESGVKFGVVEKHQFANVPAAGSGEALGYAKSGELWGHLKEQGYIDDKGKVLDKLRTAIKADRLHLPQSCAGEAAAITEVLRKLAGKLEVKNADDRLFVKTRQAVLKGDDFRALWDRIKAKTTYRVEFDNAKLIRDCVKAIDEAPPVPRTLVRFRVAVYDITKGGVETNERAASGPVALDEGDIELPDILTELQDRTQLTRKSLAAILRRCTKLGDFAKNPQAFIEQTAAAILATKRLAVVDGIRYQRLGDDQYYAQELLKPDELTGYLKNLLDVTKSIHEQVVYDSGSEKAFAQQLESNEWVKVYAKLPGWFRVPTPLGYYEPDWAVLIVKDGVERCYFVVETKPSLSGTDLRVKEQAKIDCGKAHFKAIATGASPAKFVTATSLDDVLAHT